MKSPELGSNIEIKQVSDEDFFRIIQSKGFGYSDAQIRRARGFHFHDETGAIRILIRAGSLPAEYMPYLETHERWEAYATNKKGFNLANLARRCLKRHLQTLSPDPIGDRLAEFQMDGLNNLYQFDFKHEYALWKEYQHAASDAKLEDYHALVLKLREEELGQFANEPEAFLQTKNDIAIRQSIFQKINQGKKHHFNQAPFDQMSSIK